jgi:hypothetical protein
VAGGNIESQAFPSSMDSQLVSFLKGFLVRDPARRSNDAWKLYGQLSDLRRAVFGARHEFLPFTV